MDLKKIREILGWCCILNYSLLLFAVLMFMFADDWMYDIYSNFFTMSMETYDALWFMTLGVWKVLVAVFNLIPYVAIRIINQ